MMKHFITIILACMLSINMHAESPSQDRTYISEKQNEHIVVLKTLKSSPQHEVDSLNLIINSLCKEISKQTTQIKANTIINYILIGFSIVLLIFITIVFILLNKKNNRFNKIIAELKSENKNSKNQGEDQTVKTKQSFLNDFSDLTSQQTLYYPLTTEIEENEYKKPEKVIRYFGVNSRSRFIKIYTDINDVTGFKVVFDSISMEKGEYMLTDVNKIKSSDSVNYVIDVVQPSEKMENATSYTVVENGKVVKDGNSWRVISKVKIKLK